MTSTRIVICVRCERERAIYGRGLCRPCYSSCHYAGTLHAYRRPNAAPSIGDPAEADWVLMDHVRWGHPVERITHPDDVAGVLHLYATGRIDAARVEQVLRTNAGRLMRRYRDMHVAPEAVAA